MFFQSLPLTNSINILGASPKTVLTLTAAAKKLIAPAFG